GLKVWQVRRGRDQLASRGVLAYRKTYQGRGIKLLDKKPASKLRINPRELAARAAAEQLKLRRIIDFCYEKGCLRKFVLKYFGDPKQLSSCGSCSSCSPRSHRVSGESLTLKPRRAGGTLSVTEGRAAAGAPASKLDQFIIEKAPAGDELRQELRRRAELNKTMRASRAVALSVQEPQGRILNEAETLIVRKALSCIARMNGRFGKGTVVSVLRGSKARQVLQNQLDRLSTYGLFRDMSREDISKYMRALIEAGCISVSASHYPTVSLTEFGREVMHNRAQVLLNF